MRPLLQWHNSYRMNSHLSQELDHRFKISQTGEKRLTKSIIDLALETYTAEKPRDELDGMDATFKKFAMSQVKLFLFSGHDTTSSSICYVFYLLSTHQSALDSVRREHDAVFGSPLEQRKEKLEREPFLINQLPFTLAVIKESLRLFPPLSSPRAGEPGFHVKDTDGHSFPTEGFLIWSISQAMHRDPEFWPQPDTFLPERWLVGAGDTLAPAKGAWRPFEYGPRNCIGHELIRCNLRNLAGTFLAESSQLGSRSSRMKNSGCYPTFIRSVFWGCSLGAAPGYILAPDSSAPRARAYF